MIVDELEEDPEANWLRKAGLSELLDSTSASTPGSASNLCDDSDEEESLSSMKVLSTLTKPQREAVLRRVTSFNRVQVSADDVITSSSSRDDITEGTQRPTDRSNPIDLLH